MAESTVERTERMVHTMCAAADAGDGETFASFFSESAVFRFGNNEPLTGRAAIAESTAGTVSAIHPARHHVEQIAHVGSQLFCRFVIEVTKPDGVELRLPCVTVIEMSGAQIVAYQVHMDISPALVSAPAV
jgi:ketosteroid isomerase-like protein